jgi:hypothetical protein
LVSIDQVDFRLFAQKVLIRRGASQGQALRVCSKKIFPARCAPEVFFSAKPCLSPLLNQERLLNKKPEMAPAEG